MRAFYRRTKKTVTPKIFLVWHLWVACDSSLAWPKLRIKAFFSYLGPANGFNIHIRYFYFFFVGRDYITVLLRPVGLRLSRQAFNNQPDANWSKCFHSFEGDTPVNPERLLCTPIGKMGHCGHHRHPLISIVVVHLSHESSPRMDLYFATFRKFLTILVWITWPK